MDASRQPRVLITADTVGGVWTYALELASALLGRGLRVALATMGSPLNEHQRADVSKVPAVTLYESSYRLEWMRAAWDDVDRAGEWLLEIEREFKPDIVHLNQFAFGSLPFVSPKLVVAHSCVLSWWRAVKCEPAPPDWNEYKARVALGLGGAALVATPTREMLDSLRRNYGYTQPGCVIPNGRTPAAFRPGRKKNMILAAGRLWDEAKNLAALDAAASQLPWPVRVAGSRLDPDGRIMPTTSVQCLGELSGEQLASHMANASIYALPARYEPFGLSALEAGLSGCALVLGDTGSLREVWGNAASYVDPQDHAALRDTLRALIDDPVRRNLGGDAARCRALQFTAQRMADCYLTAYASIQPALVRREAEEPQCA
jgi:glycosyltransferase involved in cell wall biosynthesis